MERLVHSSSEKLRGNGDLLTVLYVPVTRSMCLIRTSIRSN
ncbi:hypothetical protein ACFSVM_04025 [Paenibacillus shunpengii]|uniref:Uncharacterized protein n=1 Tax=Paenibacillus shunpengii TaxID=2054424 RepID=A0ABW5SJ24_9BACL